MPKADSSRLSVAVTGAAGYVGTRLINALLGEERVERVVGFDLAEPSIRDERFVFDRVDVRNETLADRFTGIDVVVHLAFIMDPIKNEMEMRDVNVNGSQNVFKCAGKAGVRRVVYTSSATVYGAHPDNDFPLTEESPLRANLDFSYPAHKLEVEYVVREVREEFPDLAFTIFRPAIVFGPHADNAWSHMLEMPALFKIQGHAPRMQFVHEEDVAEALRFAVLNELDGAFNLAAEGSLEYEHLVDIVGRRVVELPEPAAFSVADRMWQMGASEAPAGMLHYVMYPWVVSIDKLKAAGFTPRFDNRETFQATALRARENVRFGKRRVKRSDLTKGALAGVGLLGGLLTIRAARRRLVRS